MYFGKCAQGTFNAFYLFSSTRGPIAHYSSKETGDFQFISLNADLLFSQNQGIPHAVVETLEMENSL